MRQLIERRLEHSTPPDDLVAAALDRLPPGAAESWFDRPLIPAAVLVPLVKRPDGWQLVLTQRTSHLLDHPGQISFPGGRVEAPDQGPRETALRESAEEIGLDPARVQIAGYLEPLAVVTGFAVAPVVGFISGDVRFRPDPFEVAEIFEVPLDFFLDDANRLETLRTVREMSVPFSEYHFAGRRIWGATAMIIRDLTDLAIL